MTAPWHDAQPKTIWKITGRLSENHSFSQCAAIALPHSVTGGEVLFAMLPPLDYVVTPDQITDATEFATVPASQMRCDGSCSYNDGPDEECSLHGRPVRDVWRIATGAIRERDQRIDLLSRIAEVLRPHASGHDGDDSQLVRDDYMTRAQAADSAWALLQEGTETA